MLGLDPRNFVSDASMDQRPQYRLPRGVAPTKSDDGHVFEPRVGFRTRLQTGARFTHAFDVACSADAVAPVFIALVEAILPATAYLIIEAEWRPEGPDVYLSDFLPRADIEAVISKHIDLLVEDGMIAFGLAWYDDKRLEEVFVDGHKSLTVFTSRPDVVRQRLQSSGIDEAPDLELLSEHGHAHLGGPDTSDVVMREIIEPLKMVLQPRAH